MSAAGRPVLWTAAAAAAATGGRAGGAWNAAGVSIDSRTVEAGDLFIALKGPKFDGHDYVADALAAGAAAAMVHRLPDGVPAGVPLLTVGDTLEGLNGLARAARARAAARIAAVTGSVGKTGTKEALRAVLSRQGPTAASAGSLNNQWGVPLSLARMPAEAAFGVFELGMNHPGEMTPLARLVQPHVAIVTAVEMVHAAFFPSLEAIADAKAEVFAGLEAGGSAVLNRDSPMFGRLAAAATAAGAGRILGFGADPAAEARLVDFALDADGSAVRAEIAGRPLAYRVGIAGRHWVWNSLAVLAAAFALGADVAAAAAALADLVPPAGRGRRHAVDLEGGPFLLVDESYNASPVSMRAAVAVLGACRVAPGGRHIAVLGDMLELGPTAPELHAGLVGPLEEAGIDLVFTAGPAMHHLWDALPRHLRGGHAPSSEKLLPLVLAAVQPGDAVCIKGSAGSRMGLIVKALLGLGAVRPEAPRRAVNGN
jgi:UDP-N-acetylmuramoyl-tripeptide--D-alanyl-D-alanine ligase